MSREERSSSRKRPRSPDRSPSRRRPAQAAASRQEKSSSESSTEQEDAPRQPRRSRRRRSPSSQDRRIRSASPNSSPEEDAPRQPRRSPRRRSPSPERSPDRSSSRRRPAQEAASGQATSCSQSSTAQEFVQHPTRRSARIREAQEARRMRSASQNSSSEEDAPRQPRRSPRRRSPSSQDAPRQPRRSRRRRGPSSKATRRPASGASQRNTELENLIAEVENARNETQSEEKLKFLTVTNLHLRNKGKEQAQRHVTVLSRREVPTGEEEICVICRNQIRALSGFYEDKKFLPMDFGPMKERLRNRRNEATLAPVIDRNAVVRLKSCDHNLHWLCFAGFLETLMAKTTDQDQPSEIKCPACRKFYGKFDGNTPNGVMASTLVTYDEKDCIKIQYLLPGHTMGPDDEYPESSVPTFRRTQYLPANDAGYRVLRLLQIAFKRRLTFNLYQIEGEFYLDWNGIEHVNRLGKNSMRAFEQHILTVIWNLEQLGITDKSLEENQRK